jgi:O-acetyl-ADP-ribose deacetylase (regulator of RNase III)
MDEQARSERYFGRTLLRAVVGEVVDQPVEAVVYLANSRGMMEAGSAKSIRLIGGAGVEREAMALAPHRLGAIFITGSGRLQQLNKITFVFHAVLSNMLGEPPRRELVPKLLGDLLEMADQRRVRSVAIPVIGASVEASEEERSAAIDAMLDAIVSYLRRTASRIERIILVARFADDEPLLAASIDRARRRTWVE